MWGIKFTDGSFILDQDSPILSGTDTYCAMVPVKPPGMDLLEWYDVEEYTKTDLDGNEWVINSNGVFINNVGCSWNNNWNRAQQYTFHFTNGSYIGSSNATGHIYRRITNDIYAAMYINGVTFDQEFTMESDMAEYGEKPNVFVINQLPALGVCWIRVRYRGSTQTLFNLLQLFGHSGGNWVANVFHGIGPFPNSYATDIEPMPDPPGPGPGGDDPYGPGGNTGDDETDPTGGNGDFDNESDEIPIPLPPTAGAVDSGFITLYNPSMAQIQDLGSFMWSDLFDLDTFKKIFSDPMQAILGLSVVPVVPPRGSSVNVKIGNIQSGVFMPMVTSQYVQKDFGQITLNEYWGGYLDYSPYTQVEIYLPFIGVRPLATDDVMGKTLHLVYNIDLLSGACMAFIAVNEDVLYQFIGQCACSVPITGNDWTNVINGVLNIAGAIGTTVATGGLSAPQAVGAVTALASSVVSSKPRVEKSGSLSGMGGMLGVFSPYLIITRPRQALPASQNSFQGYPAFITRTLGTVSGFTRVADVHLDGLTCTDAEKSEIKQLLEQGVIL